jgi:hypothetical protein
MNTASLLIVLDGVMACEFRAVYSDPGEIEKPTTKTLERPATDTCHALRFLIGTTKRSIFYAIILVV